MPVRKSTKATEKKGTAKTPAKKTAVKRRTRIKTDVESEKLRDAIVKILDDGKADNITVIDLHGKTTMADFMVIASGTSSRHIISLADNVLKKLKQEFKLKAVVEGRSISDWVVIDAYDVIVHIFHPQARELYDIEEIWQ